VEKASSCLNLIAVTRRLRYHDHDLRLTGSKRRKRSMNRRRTPFLALVLALLTAAVAAPGIQLAGGATERLANGNFEGGFYPTPVGMVANHWKWFNNGGQASYGFYDETWAPVVYDGKHSVLVEINTYDRAGSDPDRYAGIYQTVAVVPGETYELSLHGMMRVLEDDPDMEGYNYRVQYGIDHNGGQDWKAVSEWYELPWNTVYPRLTPGSMDSYSTSIEATSNRLTLFVRAWKKWGTAMRELDVNLDAISLKGAMPGDVDKGKAKPATSEDEVVSAADAGLSVGFQAPEFPVRGWEYIITVEASSDLGISKLQFFNGKGKLGELVYDVGPLTVSQDFVWKPEEKGKQKLSAVAYDMAGAAVKHKVTVNVGRKGSFLENGGFEEGFYSKWVGEVGNAWGWFNNGGPAAYGYYDDTWPPVVAEGEHSQLLEINTYGRSGSAPDRYAGIYQTVEGLTVGATYELSMKGMIRALANDPDIVGFNYRVQWGYTLDGSTEWREVDNWVEVPWNRVYPRLEPGRIRNYSASFKAPSEKITVFIRAWKKWGTAMKELDVNLDSIKLVGYD
jgi:hypothetical protein